MPVQIVEMERAGPNALSVRLVREGPPRVVVAERTLTPLPAWFDRSYPDIFVGCIRFTEEDKVDNGSF